MDNHLKQRLVGAVVLVALAVIFIPMLLEGPDRTLVPDMGEMPEPEVLAPELPLEPFPPGDEPGPALRAIVSDAVAPPVDDKAEPDAAPAASPEAATAAAAESAPPAVEQPAPAATPAPATASSAPPAVVDAWVVQVVSLSSKANALALRDKLRKGGFATQVEEARIEGKTRYRVRVGPFLERGEAEQARKQLAERFGHKGRVLSAR